MNDEQPKPRRPRGFAAMDKRKVSEIAAKGGRAAHQAGTAHEFNSEEARIAGRKGGHATHAKRAAVAGKETAPATQTQTTLQYDADKDEVYGGTDSD